MTSPGSGTLCIRLCRALWAFAFVASVWWKYCGRVVSFPVLSVQLCSTGSLKWDLVGVFLPWKLADPTDQGPPRPHLTPSLRFILPF